MSTVHKKILVLSSADSSDNRKINDEFVAGISQHIGPDIKVSWSNFSEIGFHFKDDTIIPFWITDGQPLDVYDFVYIKSYYRYTENALVLTEYFKQAGIKFVCSELDNSISFTKLSQYARLTRAQLPVPETVFIPYTHLGLNYRNIVAILDTPFIFKAIDAKGGGANYLIHSQMEYDKALEENQGQEFVSQKFIPNESDLRILVLGDAIELIIKRQRQDDSTHLNNTSQGGGATLLPLEELDENSQIIARKAAKLLHREIAGVDLMFATDTGKPYILEVNASPQVASGAFTKEKIEKYSNFLQNMVQ
jgi:glutathione synthase/RimK-type ligase-like ATP-grasp enzyme